MTNSADNQHFSTQTKKKKIIEKIKTTQKKINIRLFRSCVAPKVAQIAAVAKCWEQKES